VAAYLHHQCPPDTAAITAASKNSALQATADSLRQTSGQITSNPSLSDLAKNAISTQLNGYGNLLEGKCGGTGTVNDAVNCPYRTN
jgi:hypothetical protein